MQRYLARDTRKGLLDSRFRLAPRGQRPGAVRGARRRARHLQIVRDGRELHAGQLLEAAARRGPHPEPPDGDGLPGRRGRVVASSLRVQAAGHAGDDGAEPAVEEREHQGEVSGDDSHEALTNGPGAAEELASVDMLGSCQPWRAREQSTNTQVRGEIEVRVFMSNVETNLESEHGAEDSGDGDKNTASKQTYKACLLDHGKRGPEEHGDRDKYNV